MLEIENKGDNGVSVLLMVYMFIKDQIMLETPHTSL